MNTIKTAAKALFIFLAILSLAPAASHAGTCTNCTVTVVNNTSYYADVTLDYSPNGSAVFSMMMGAIAPGQTLSIPVPADKCPLRLSGTIWTQYSNCGMNSRCVGSNTESNSCSVENCKSSTWKMEGGGGAFHFIKQ